ncbi:hypothetical protein [Nocardiopsis sp. NPDC006938]|uniref:hypothetical protein n=1 Tax=Nocardiopsis sp. NPDC006938 TaxID=3364337 RepID=UPI003679B20E
MTSLPRRVYGASPWHLLLMVGVLALIAYAGTRLLHGGDPWMIAVWFAGGALLHDLVLVPAYTLVGRAVRRVGRRVGRHAGRGAGRRGSTAVPDLVLVPATASGLLLLVYLPLILGPPDAYVSKTGLTGEPFAARWLLVSAVLLAASAAVGAARARRAARRDRPG